MTPAELQVACDVLRERGLDASATEVVAMHGLTARVRVIAREPSADLVEVAEKVSEMRELLEGCVDLADDGALGDLFTYDEESNDNRCNPTCDCTLCQARNLTGWKP